jgi:pimeloyl-ACP methyl ester carboxylesterase
MTDPTTASIRQRRIDVGTAELDVLEAGDPGAPVIVLSHGFPESSWSWRHQIPALAAAGYHVLAPDQRGYGRSSAPKEVTAYGIEQLTGDLLNLVDTTGQRDAVFMGHDWGALIVWDLAKLHPERCRAVVGLSVPFVHWPAPPTQLMKAVYTDRFFYILYFQQVGPAETEMELDVANTMRRVLWGASGEGFTGPRGELPPMEGTGFLTQTVEPPPLPWSWLTEADFERYVDAFTASGYFGPVSYYRNLDANFALLDGKGPEQATMPTYFVAGSKDVVLVMDPGGVERMSQTLPNFKGATIIDGAGHWVQQEAPAETNAALLAFLATL